MRHLRPADYRRMPWRNGGGTTSEIARADGLDGELDWRVSIADVASDGPFSRFPGCERVIVVVAGAGMTLEHPASGARVALAPLAPYRFDGDVETVGALRDGPVRDFNLMTRRDRYAGDVAVVRGGDAAGAGRAALMLPPDATLVHCLGGEARVTAAGGATLPLDAGESALREPAEAPLAALHAPAGAVLLVVSLARRD